jgi:hypothetical protein
LRLGRWASQIFSANAAITDRQFLFVFFLRQVWNSQTLYCFVNFLFAICSCELTVRINDTTDDGKPSYCNCSVVNCCKQNTEDKWKYRMQTLHCLDKMFFKPVLVTSFHFKIENNQRHGAHSFLKS